MLNVLIWTVLTINIVTFVVWGIDKWQAKRGRRRVPEAHLLLLAAATGCVGAWLGVTVFRHKSQKVSFRLMLLVSSLVNVIWVWAAWKLGVFQ